MIQSNNLETCFNGVFSIYVQITLYRIIIKEENWEIFCISCYV